MKVKSVQKKTDWSPEVRARHQAIREKFRHPHTYEELVASGELSGKPVPLGIYLQLRALVAKLKKARAKAGLSLADLAKQTGMAKAALSRLENHANQNPSFQTILRYAFALGKDLEFRLVDHSKT